MADKPVVGGSVKSVSIEGREFPVDAACDAVFDTGGFSNTVEITGSGESIVAQERIPWQLLNVDLVISEDRGDLGFLAGVFNAIVEPFAPSLAIPAPPTGPDRDFLGEVIARGTFVPITVTQADDTTHTGRGTIVGSIQRSTMTGLAKVSFAGDGEMTKQSASRPSLFGFL
jgi:hypothetical protein